MRKDNLLNYWESKIPFLTIIQPSPMVNILASSAQGRNKHNRKNGAGRNSNVGQNIYPWPSQF